MQNTSHNYINGLPLIHPLPSQREWTIMLVKLKQPFSLRSLRSTLYTWDPLPNLVLPEPLLLAIAVVDFIHTKCAGSKTLPATTATREAKLPRLVKTNYRSLNLQLQKITWWNRKLLQILLIIMEKSTYSV